jgi:hypothetical protein
METAIATVRRRHCHSHTHAEEELEGNRQYDRDQDRKTSAKEEREERKRNRKRKQAGFGLQRKLRGQRGKWRGLESAETQRGWEEVKIREEEEKTGKQESRRKNNKKKKNAWRWLSREEERRGVEWSDTELESISESIVSKIRFRSPGLDCLCI